MNGWVIFFICMLGINSVLLGINFAIGSKKIGIINLIGAICCIVGLVMNIIRQ